MPSGPGTRFNVLSSPGCETRKTATQRTSNRTKTVLPFFFNVTYQKKNIVSTCLSRKEKGEGITVVAMPERKNNLITFEENPVAN